MEATCACKNIQSDTTVESIFLVIVLGYYDGPTSGVMQCRTCTNVYRFMMVDWDDDQDVRIHALVPLPPECFQQVVDLISPYESPRWPTWFVVLRNISDENRNALNQPLDELLESAGPATSAVALSQWGEQVLAVRPLTESDQSDVQDWFSLEGDPARDWFSFMGLIKFMTHEELDEFVKVLQSKGWTVVLRDVQLPLNLGNEVANRYPNIPGDYLDFLRYVSGAYNAEGNVSFLCESDYNGSAEGSWNEFELLELEAGERWGPAELLTIKAFWDRHFPFMISYMTDGCYLAMDLSPDNYGVIVDACSPDIDGIGEVSRSFREFIQRFSDDLKNETDELEFPEFSSMDCDLHRIDVQLSDNNIAPARLLVWEEAPENRELVKLTLKFNDREISSMEDDYFSAMRAIRRGLEQENALLRCYGASRNVYLSEMSRSMGSGLKAYKLSLGSPAKLADLVSIFDTGPDVVPVTVAQQDDFFNKWKQSLG